MASPVETPDLRAARRVVAVTAANSDLPDYATRGPTRALTVGTAGTLNFMDAEGNIVTGYPAQAGENSLAVRQVRTGGTASDIWALY